MSAGYSGKPAYKKLGLKDGLRMLIFNEPVDYFGLIGVPDGEPLAVEVAESEIDYVYFFTKERAEFERELPRLKGVIQQAGMIWVSWPKKASKVPTDMTEDVIRNYAISIGLVDIKVCAVDKVWSGLELVIPVKDRQ